MSILGLAAVAANTQALAAVCSGQIEASAPSEGALGPAGVCNPPMLGSFSSGSQAETPVDDRAERARVQALLGHSVSPVPEPPGYAMMLLGFAAIAVVLRRRRRPPD